MLVPSPPPRPNPLLCSSLFFCFFVPGAWPSPPGASSPSLPDPQTPPLFVSRVFSLASFLANQNVLSSPEPLPLFPPSPLPPYSAPSAASAGLCAHEGGGGGGPSQTTPNGKKTLSPFSRGAKRRPVPPPLLFPLSLSPREGRRASVAPRVTPLAPSSRVRSISTEESSPFQHLSHPSFPLVLPSDALE